MFYKVGQKAYSLRNNNKMWIKDHRGLSRQPGEIWGSNEKPEGIIPGVEIIDSPETEKEKVEIKRVQPRNLRDKKIDVKQNKNPEVKIDDSLIAKEKEIVSDSKSEEIIKEEMPPVLDPETEEKIEQQSKEAEAHDDTSEDDKPDFEAVLKLSQADILQWAKEEAAWINDLIKTETEGKNRKLLIAKLNAIKG